MTSRVYNTIDTFFARRAETYIYTRCSTVRISHLLHRALRRLALAVTAAVAALVMDDELPALEGDGKAALRVFVGPGNSRMVERADPAQRIDPQRRGAPRTDLGSSNPDDDGVYPRLPRGITSAPPRPPVVPVQQIADALAGALAGAMMRDAGGSTMPQPSLPPIPMPDARQASATPPVDEHSRVQEGGPSNGFRRDQQASQTQGDGRVIKKARRSMVRDVGSKSAQLPTSENARSSQQMMDETAALHQSRCPPSKACL